jgi:hypothetical protein
MVEYMKMYAAGTAGFLLLATLGLSAAAQTAGPEFSTALSPASVTLPQNSVTSVTLTIESAERAVFAITVTGLPEGVQAQALSGHTGINTVVLRSSSAAQTGTFAVQITASAENNSQTQLLALLVKPAPITPQWEYNVLVANSYEEFLSQSNDLGSQGWELVSVTFRESDAPHFVGFFKRVKR